MYIGSFLRPTKEMVCQSLISHGRRAMDKSSVCPFPSLLICHKAAKGHEDKEENGRHF